MSEQSEQEAWDGGYSDGLDDGRKEAAEPLITVLETIRDMWPSQRHQYNLDLGDWRKIAEEMSDHAARSIP